VISFVTQNLSLITGLFSYAFQEHGLQVVRLDMSSEKRENDGPNYKHVNITEIESHSTPDTEFRCSGGRATAHLKAIAHVSPNLLCTGMLI
jgi:hypothetical protein